MTNESESDRWHICEILHDSITTMADFDYWAEKSGKANRVILTHYTVWETYGQLPPIERPLYDDAYTALYDSNKSFDIGLRFMKAEEEENKPKASASDLIQALDKLIHILQHFDLHESAEAMEGVKTNALKLEELQKARDVLTTAQERGFTDFPFTDDEGHTWTFEDFQSLVESTQKEEVDVDIHIGPPEPGKKIRVDIHPTTDPVGDAIREQAGMKENNGLSGAAKALRKEMYESVPLKEAPNSLCPRCGGPVPDAEHLGQYPGARSRTDNETEVCSQCGTDEAMEQWAGALTPQDKWPVKNRASVTAIPRTRTSWDDARRSVHPVMMPFPGPKEMPDLRLHFLDRWQPEGIFRRTVQYRVKNITDQVLEEFGLDAKGAQLDERVDIIGQQHLETISKSSLWWVKDELVDLTSSAGRTVPDEIKGIDCHLPAEQQNGLVCLQNPWRPHSDDKKIRVRAFTWRKYKGKIYLDFYDYIDFDEGIVDLDVAVATGAIFEGRPDIIRAAGPNGEGAARIYGSAWMWQGASTWGLRETAAEVTARLERENGSFEDGKDGSWFPNSEDLKFFAAFCALVNQRLTHIEEHPMNNARRKQADRAKHPIRNPSPVRLVRLRQAPSRSEDRDPDAERRHVAWTHRWIVEGHWAWRRCGPKKSLRRLVYIAPFIKGPADKELVYKEKVWTVVR